MKTLLAFGLFVTFSQSAFSMPCDSGYLCVSKTAKYKIEFQRCRYRNRINLISTKINGVDVPTASLNQGWDGDSILAFEINLPTAVDGAVKILTAEIAHLHAGILRVKYASSEPGPLSTIHTEKISCKIEE